MEEKIKLELTKNEFNLILDRMNDMRCIVRDGHPFIENGRDYCNGQCNGKCDRPDLCNIKGWLESKIID